jgi:hypothetical protein
MHRRRGERELREAEFDFVCGHELQRERRGDATCGHVVADVELLRGRDDLGYLRRSTGLRAQGSDRPNRMHPHTARWRVVPGRLCRTERDVVRASDRHAQLHVWVQRRAERRLWNARGDLHARRGDVSNLEVRFSVQRLHYRWLCRHGIIVLWPVEPRRRVWPRWRWRERQQHSSVLHDGLDQRQRLPSRGIDDLLSVTATFSSRSAKIVITIA